VKKFTLLELLVAIAVIGILLTVLMPSLSKAREKARIAVCMSNQKQIAYGLVTYSMANNSFLPHAYNFPTNYSWDDSISEHLGLKWLDSEKSKNSNQINVPGWEIFKCPSNNVTFNEIRRSYAVNKYNPTTFRHTPGLMCDDVSINMAKITIPEKTLFVGEQWRIWNKVGSESEQNAGYHYAKLKYEPASGWYAHLTCHGNGKANLSMADTSVVFMNGRNLLKGSLDDTTNRYQGSWLDHTK